MLILLFLEEGRNPVPLQLFIICWEKNGTLMGWGRKGTFSRAVSLRAPIPTWLARLNGLPGLHCKADDRYKA